MAWAELQGCAEPWISLRVRTLARWPTVVYMTQARNTGSHFTAFTRSFSSSEAKVLLLGVFAFSLLPGHISERPITVLATVLSGTCLCCPTLNVHTGQERHGWGARGSGPLRALVRDGQWPPCDTPSTWYVTRYGVYSALLLRVSTSRQPGLLYGVQSAWTGYQYIQENTPCG